MKIYTFDKIYKNVPQEQNERLIRFRASHLVEHLSPSAPLWVGFCIFPEVEEFLIMLYNFICAVGLCDKKGDDKNMKVIGRRDRA